MRYATLCSGIEGFGVGFDRANMSPVFQCEADKHALQILQRHYPEVPRTEDVNDERTMSELVRLRPDVVAFGSPCQDLSVAGKRGGLAGKRSGLFFRCVELCFACEAEWVVWENVPGVFSSAAGEDFASVLEAFTGFRPQVPKEGWLDTGVCIGPLYSVAWAVLDSQWFGLAQRRKRVFLVGHLGSRSGPYEVLSLAASVPWDSPPSREARKDVAGTLDARTDAGGFPGSDGHVVAFAQNTRDEVREIGGNIAGALAAEPGMKQQTYIAHTLRAEGHDASEDGTGRGVPLVAAILRSRQHSPGVSMPGRGGEDDQNLLVTPIDMRQASRGEKMTNNRKEGSSGGAPGTGIGEAGDPSPTLADSHTPAVAYAIQERAVSENIENGPQGKGWQEEQAFTLEARHHAQAVAQTGVRRLTPVECERLQGFSDGWTEPLSDSARYRCLGNAVSVPVAEWIGRRIMEVSRQ